MNTITVKQQWYGELYSTLSMMVRDPNAVREIAYKLLTELDAVWESMGPLDRENYFEPQILAGCLKEKYHIPMPDSVRRATAKRRQRDREYRFGSGYEGIEI